MSNTVLEPSRKALIIGGGIAGLAAAIRLQVKGYQSIIFEQNDFIGGKLAECRINDFRFDMGPSLFTLPQLVEDLFNLAGKNIEDYFSYTPTKSCCNYFYEDGTSITGYTNRKQFLDEIQSKLKIDPSPVNQYLDDIEVLYNVTKPVFLESSLHKLGTYFSKDVLTAMTKLHKLNLGSSMNRVNQKRLKHPKLVQIFNRFGTYTGSNPYVAPAVLNMIPHLEHNIGTYFPEKGMYSIPTVLAQLAQDIGVDIKYNSPVEEILYTNKQIKGLRVNGEEIQGNLVISNADTATTYQKLMPTFSAPKRVYTHERSSSALIFYWAIDKEFPQLDLHNIFFSERYEEEFKAIFDEKDIIDDPTVYVFISSKYCPDDAPKGKENWFVMINVPANEQQDWEALKTRAREAIVQKLNRMLNVDIEAHILGEKSLDPRGIEKRTAAYKGALYGISSNNLFASFLRHPNFSSKVKGLYFCGGTVHPGGGIPLCLLSAQIVDQMIGSA